VLDGSRALAAYRGRALGVTAVMVEASSTPWRHRRAVRVGGLDDEQRVGEQASVLRHLDDGVLCVFAGETGVLDAVEGQ